MVSRRDQANQGADLHEALFSDEAFAPLKRGGAPFVVVDPARKAVLWANAAAGQLWRADGSSLAATLFGPPGAGALGECLAAVRPGRRPQLLRLRLQPGFAMRADTILARAVSTPDTEGTLVGFAVPGALRIGSEASAWDDPLANLPVPAPAPETASEPPTDSAPPSSEPTFADETAGADLARRSHAAVLRDRLVAALDGATTLRFLWRSDADSRLTRIDDTVLRGLRAALRPGEEPFAEALARSDAAGGAALQRALAAHASWSALRVEMPVADGAATVPVLLSGAPVFGPGRRFAGHRGFGTLDLAALAIRPPAEEPARTEAAEDRAAEPPASASPETPPPAPIMAPAEPPAPLAANDAGAPPAPTAWPGFPNVVELRAFQAQQSGRHAPASQGSGEAPRPLERDETTLPDEPPSDDIAFLALGAALREQIDAAGARASAPEASPAIAGESAARADDPRADEPAPATMSEPLPRPASGGPVETGENHAVTGAEPRDWDIVDGVDDVVALLDGEGRVRRLNRRGLALVGTTAIGQPLATLVATETKVPIPQLLVEARGRRERAPATPSRHEVNVRTVTGGAQQMGLTIGRLGESGFYATLRERAPEPRGDRDEARLKRDRQHEAARLLDILARLDREIRTPLNAILGFAEVMMEERFGALGSPRYRDYLRDIHSSGSQVIALVADLLDLSRIEAGQVSLEPATIDLNRVVGDVVAQGQAEAHRERIIVRTSFSPRLPAVLVDEGSLRQIVQQLVSNAVKFNEPGGQVIVSTAQDETGAVVMRIRDTGIGMTDAEIAAAIEPFTTASPESPSPGNGLGLTLARALVGANGASLTIRSRPREGTLVEVTFPKVVNTETRRPA